MFGTKLEKGDDGITKRIPCKCAPDFLIVNETGSYT
jgi:hypothetical protein